MITKIACATFCICGVCYLIGYMIARNDTALIMSGVYFVGSAVLGKLIQNDAK